MREKLLLFMKNENLTSSRLAELLGIQPSGISHILAGRNKPSFDFVHKLLRRYPKLNPDWLLLDSEQMYRDSLSSVASQSEAENNPTEIEESNIDFSTAASEPSTQSANATNISVAQKSHIPDNITVTEKISNSPKAIKRVIILYADHTFESYEG